jgi:carboxyl-terminal processing protease
MYKKTKILFFTIFIFFTSLIFSSYTDNDYFEISKNLEILSSIYKELNALYVDDTNPGDLMKKGIDAMLESLDPYTTYIPESQIEDFRFMKTGEYGGIGAVITKIDDYVCISEPYEGFPAQKSGLMAGDKILKIDGISAKGKSTEDVSKILKGEKNTTVDILIERDSSKKPIKFSFKRK